MPKPDKALRTRPLRELEGALSKLKRVVLLHPDPIVQEVPPKYCVCKQVAERKGDHTTTMIACSGCWEWFHFDCLGWKDDDAPPGDGWRCEWCRDPVDKAGYQRWRKDRKRPKKRHHLDTPRHNRASIDADPPRQYTAPPSWDGKVAQVKELARRAAIKKRKLTEAVEQLVAEGGHHLADAQGMAGLEVRPVDGAVVDDYIANEMVAEADFEESD